MKERIKKIPPVPGATPREERMRQEVNRIVDEAARSMDALEARVRRLEEKEKKKGGGV